MLGGNMIRGGREEGRIQSYLPLTQQEGDMRFRPALFGTWTRYNKTAHCRQKGPTNVIELER